MNISNVKEFSGKPESKQKKKLWIIPLSVLLALMAAFGALIGVRAGQFAKIDSAEQLSVEQTEALRDLIGQNYPDHSGALNKLPYKITNPDLDIYAKSAIIIDTATGDVLYEKNADEVIPPASMTKLFTMFIIEEYIRAGKFDYDTVVPLPPECWACNMPAHSSLMFLGEGQRVTVEELLQGLSVCSGNDAAVALAGFALKDNKNIDSVDDLMNQFTELMNKVARQQQLTHTHFADCSGYSEKNTTTAREMAAFIRFYLKMHPDSLERFHCLPEFTYPKKRNLAPGDTLQTQDWSNGLTRHITMQITQKNTNPLLGKLAGCDGLKTGYIDESGYNLSLTAVRNGTRFLSVTMGGPGNNAAEGQAGRVHDGTELMEWAFGSFSDLYSEDLNSSYFVKCYGAKDKGMYLISVYDSPYFCVPYITGQNQKENLAAVKIEKEIPDYCFGEIQEGQQLGQIKISLAGYLLDTIPLVADRSVEKSNFIIQMADSIIK